MQKYQCIACGWIYDPAENDNVPFEQLPEDFVCPECGVGKDMLNPSINKPIAPGSIACFPVFYFQLIISTEKHDNYRIQRNLGFCRRT
jgi:rubredoxin